MNRDGLKLYCEQCGETRYFVFCYECDGWEYYECPECHTTISFRTR